MTTWLELWAAHLDSLPLTANRFSLQDFVLSTKDDTADPSVLVPGAPVAPRPLQPIELLVSEEVLPPPPLTETSKSQIIGAPRSHFHLSTGNASSLLITSIFDDSFVPVDHLRHAKLNHSLATTGSHRSGEHANMAEHHAARGNQGEGEEEEEEQGGDGSCTERIALPLFFLCDDTDPVHLSTTFPTHSLLEQSFSFELDETWHQKARRSRKGILKVNAEGATHVYGSNGSNCVLQFQSQSLLSKKQFAYATIISGVDLTFKYRGMLLSVLVLVQGMRDLHTPGTNCSARNGAKNDDEDASNCRSGSIEDGGGGGGGGITDERVQHGVGPYADFVVLVSVKDSEALLHPTVQADLQLLRRLGLIVYTLPRPVPAKDVGEAFRPTPTLLDRDLSKLSVWALLRYQAVQYLDPATVVLGDLSYMFRLAPFGVRLDTFCQGLRSPLGLNWFMAVPDRATAQRLHQILSWRASHPFHPMTAYGQPLPRQTLWLPSAGRYLSAQWRFSRAATDVGIIIQHFVLDRSQVLILNATNSQLLLPEPRGHLVQPLSPTSRIPTQKLRHFSRSQLPWQLPGGAQQLELKVLTDPAYALWARALDRLGLNVNSSNVAQFFNCSAHTSYTHSRGDSL